MNAKSDGIRPRGRFWMMLIGLAGLAPVACSNNLPPGPAPCAADADCEADEVCYQGYCRASCGQGGGCPDGQVCVSGACLTPCETDGDCPRGETCQRGFCQPEPADRDGGDGDGGGQECIDADNDGYGENCAAGPDCDDGDRTVHPGADEQCADGVDNDCDGQTDEDDCGCTYGDRMACYTGPAGTDGVGICHAGVASCNRDRTWGACLGEQHPADETCNGLDDDCDGEVDEGLLNACGQCEPPDDQLQEVCANGLDDDCDGEVDENCSCDPNCQCEAGGAGQQCTCHPPTGQPCYSGPPNTLGFGICRGGVHDCVEQPDGSWAWSACEGEVLPATECDPAADAIDNDCDGLTDEGCLPDGDGDGYAPPADCADDDPEVHPGAAETCNGADDDCDGIVDEGVTNPCGDCGPVAEEVCHDGLDNDCDGLLDEGCGGCSGSDSRPCYTGPPDTVDHGNCSWGEQVCDGEFWGACEGDVLPEPEVCDGADNDCDDEIDERWAIGANPCGYCDGEEICDGLDNDCDGFTDEGLVNACGDCLPVPDETECDGLDNDCDGLTDEGLLNACGTCGDSCYEQEWGGEDDWQYGEADGVSNSVDPDSLQLDSETQSPHYIWIAGTNVICNEASGCLTDPPCYPGEICHTVKKFDTETDELIGVYSTWGWSPSRTAVAVDNSVWVGNRGCQNNLSGCDGGDPNHGNAVHLDADGNLICRADVTGSPVAVRGVTLDADGNAWLGSWDGAHIYKYSGTEVDDSQPDGIPRCVQLCAVDLADGQGTSRAYGAAVDSNGFLWIATLNNGPLRKIDTATCEIVMSVDPGRATYGVAIDANDNPWFGCWDGGCPCGAIKVDGQTGAASCIGRSVGDTGGGRTRGVAVDPDGNVWVAEWDHNTVSKFAPDGTHLGQWSVSGFGHNANGPLGMAVDFNDNIWAISYSSGHATKFASDGTQLDVFPVGGSPYTYSDMTGFQLRNITLKHGTWTVDYDSGYAGAIWDRLEWSGAMGPDDRIRVRARSAPSEGELVGAGWSPQYEADPQQAPPWSADIHGVVPPNRWIQVQVTLNTEDEVSPSFSDLRVFWQR
jgi:streptogramin lyase